jgi:copper(I)-binding protein
MEPGGPHLALTGLREPLGPGAAVGVVLRFERAGEVTVQLRGHDH